MQIVIPMSGFGNRFLKAGYKITKPLIRGDNKPIICHVIDLYPEYHAALSDYRQTERRYDDPQSNPFLKMSLHVAILEQVSTNRPQGILEVYQKASRHMPVETVEKLMATVLYDQMQTAILQGDPPDEVVYLRHLTQTLCGERP